MIRPTVPLGLLALLTACSAENAFRMDGSADAAYDDTGYETDADNVFFDTADSAAEDTYEPESESDFLKLACGTSDS